MARPKVYDLPVLTDLVADGLSVAAQYYRDIAKRQRNPAVRRAYLARAANWWHVSQELTGDRLRLATPWCEFEKTGEDSWTCRTHDTVTMQRHEPDRCRMAQKDGV